MNEPNEVVRTSRQVIEFTEQDLKDVIYALCEIPWGTEVRQFKRCKNLIDGFRKLQREAFPK